jgi:hypothetical protein
MAKNHSPEVGDAVEIRIGLRYSYGHYTQRHSMHGGVLRVLAGIFDSPADLETLRQLPVRFIVLFPVEAAAKRGLIRAVGKVALTGDRQNFPLFKAAMRDPANGEVTDWWLWNGTREWRVGSLDEADDLPLRASVSLPDLIVLIEN